MRSIQLLFKLKRYAFESRLTAAWPRICSRKGEQSLSVNLKPFYHVFFTKNLAWISRHDTLSAHHLSSEIFVTRLREMILFLSNTLISN